MAHKLDLYQTQHNLDYFAKGSELLPQDKNLLDNNLKLRNMVLPDKFIDQDKPEQMYKIAGLDSFNIVDKVLETLNSKVIIKKTN